MGVSSYIRITKCLEASYIVRSRKNAMFPCLSQISNGIASADLVTLSNRTTWACNGNQLKMMGVLAQEYLIDDNVIVALPPPRTNVEIAGKCLPWYNQSRKICSDLFLVLACSLPQRDDCRHLHRKPTLLVWLTVAADSGSRRGGVTSKNLSPSPDKVLP